jgi:hypothetical protein
VQDERVKMVTFKEVRKYSNIRVGHIPYGGVKENGIGRVKYVIQEMAEWKLAVIIIKKE